MYANAADAACCSAAFAAFAASFSTLAAAAFACLAAFSFSKSRVPPQSWHVDLGHTCLPASSGFFAHLYLTPSSLRPHPGASHGPVATLLSDMPTTN